MEINIYTDGSCSQSGKSQGPGGWALICFYEGKETIIEKGNSIKTTNNRMELTAFLEALKKYSNLKSENELIKKLNIFSDSAYITNCFKQKWYKNWIRNGWLNAKKREVANRDLWEKIFKYYFSLTEISFVEIIKVKGHANNEGNIMADKYAVMARKELENEKEEGEENEKCFDINTLY